LCPGGSPHTWDPLRGSNGRVRSLASLPRRTNYWDLGPARRVSCGWQKLLIMYPLWIASHPIPTSCLYSPLSSSSLIIPAISSCHVSSHTLSHTTRGGAPHARRLVEMYFHLTRRLSSHSPILVSFVTRIGCHPDRPLSPQPTYRYSAIASRLRSILF
jgi:hypothetical protein